MMASSLSLTCSDLMHSEAFFLMLRVYFLPSLYLLLRECADLTLG